MFSIPSYFATPLQNTLQRTSQSAPNLAESSEPHEKAPVTKKQRICRAESSLPSPSSALSQFLLSTKEISKIDLETFLSISKIIPEKRKYATLFKLTMGIVKRITTYVSAKNALPILKERCGDLFNKEYLKKIYIKACLQLMLLRKDIAMVSDSNFGGLRQYIVYRIAGTLLEPGKIDIYRWSGQPTNCGSNKRVYLGHGSFNVVQSIVELSTGSFRALRTIDYELRSKLSYDSLTQRAQETHFLEQFNLRFADVKGITPPPLLELNGLMFNEHDIFIQATVMDKYDGDLSKIQFSELSPAQQLSFLRAFVSVVKVVQLINTEEITQSSPIAHRDIKPANILYRMVGDSFEFFLNDFGIAEHYHKILWGSVVNGSNLYLASDTELLRAKITAWKMEADEDQAKKLHQEIIKLLHAREVFSLGKTLRKCCFPNDKEPEEMIQSLQALHASHPKLHPNFYEDLALTIFVMMSDDCINRVTFEEVLQHLESMINLPHPFLSE